MRQRRSRTNSGSIIRIIIGLAIGAFSLFSYFASQEYNPVTGENQHISITAEQEIALGLQSTPELIREFGGLYPDNEVQQFVDNIGNRIVANSVAQDTPWEFEFYVLDDPSTVNAFALPGGPVFITTALMSETNREDQIAAVIAHEIAHVVARHGAQRIAKSELTNGLIGAVGVASGGASETQTAAMIGQLINMGYSREHEMEADTLGVCLMIDAGYDPHGMVEVMEILASVSGGARPPEFLSTHPDPDNRVKYIGEAIDTAPTECPQ